MYIPWKYQSGWDIPVIYQTYSLYIQHGISLVYTINIKWIYFVYPLYISGIYYGYAWNIIGIYLYIRVYTWYIHSILCVYTPPCGWCCGGGFHQKHRQSHTHIAWTSHNFNLTINLYHDAWLMSDWSSVQYHTLRNLGFRVT